MSVLNNARKEIFPLFPARTGFDPEIAPIRKMAKVTKIPVRQHMSTYPRTNQMLCDIAMHSRFALA